MNKWGKRLCRFAVYGTLFAAIYFGLNILKDIIFNQSITWHDLVLKSAVRGVIWGLLYPLIEKSSKKDKERERKRKTKNNTIYNT